MDSAPGDPAPDDPAPDAAPKGGAPGEPGRLVAVLGATGRQGGAVARHLLADGWRVRALTRTPDSDKAQALAALGAEVVRADLADSGSLDRAFASAYGVFSVQNPLPGGLDHEVEHGCAVGDSALAAGVQHLVYGSAGSGAPATGVRTFDNKRAIEAHLRTLDLGVTVLRPMAFMELMTDKDFFPPVSMWHLMPRLVGEDRPLPWICTDDLGAVAARVFAEPDRFVGQDLSLATDVKTLAQCRDAWRRVKGRTPRRFPMPEWVFKRVAEPDLLAMWRWLATADLDLDTAPTRALVPDADTVEQFLARR